ncbi:hypothetical protein X772_29770 [Mesorhizobium sp. LSJC280B00]|nr:hypothetical protein X772_29770 [Mesorhizobium sp. LSJC280B00]
MVRANAGKRVTLSPDTALFVGLKLLTASAKPTAAEVALMICDSKCERPCYPCQGKANGIVRAYGTAPANAGLHRFTLLKSRRDTRNCVTCYFGSAFLFTNLVAACIMACFRDEKGSAMKAYGKILLVAATGLLPTAAYADTCDTGKDSCSITCPKRCYASWDATAKTCSKGCRDTLVEKKSHTLYMSINGLTKQELMSLLKGKKLAD